MDIGKVVEITYIPKPEEVEIPAWDEEGAPISPLEDPEPEVAPTPDVPEHPEEKPQVEPQDEPAVTPEEEPAPEVIPWGPIPEPVRAPEPEGPAPMPDPDAPEHEPNAPEPERTDAPTREPERVRVTVR